MEYYGTYPQNDYRYYLQHYAKGEEADDHKYIKKTTTKNGKIRYFCQMIRRKCLYAIFYSKKIIRSLERRLGIIKTFRA